MQHVILSNYDSRNNPYYAGGGAYLLHEIAKRLSDVYRITYLCGAYPQCKDESVDEVFYKHIGSSWFGPRLGQVVFSLSLPIYVWVLHFDIWLENFVPPHSTNMLQFFTSKPVVGITLLLDAEKFSKKYKLPFHLIEQFGLKHYRYIITFSQSLKERIVAANAKAKVAVIPLGIDASLLRLTPTETNTILFIGRLDNYQKGLDVLVKAWKSVVQENPDFQLVIAGSGTPSDTTALKKLIRDKGVQKSVNLVGKVGGKQKEQLLAQCVIGVVPSRFETFGIAALELLAAQKPLVASDIDGFNWIPNTVCVKVPPTDPEALARAMTNLLRDAQKRKQLGRAGRAFARQFNWDDIASQYKTFISEILQPKRSENSSKQLV